MILPMHLPSPIRSTLHNALTGAIQSMGLQGTGHVGSGDGGGIGHRRCVRLAGQAFRTIGHPVSWIGRLINHMDQRFNLPEDSPAQKRSWGRITLAIVLATAILPTALIAAILPDGLIGVF